MDELEKLLGADLWAQVSKVLGEKKAAIISDGSYLPREKFNEVNESLKSVKSELTARDKQLNDLKASAGDNEALKEKITALETQNKTTAAEFEKTVLNMKRESALDAHIGSLAVNPATLKRLINKDTLELDEHGAIKAGIEDQIKALKASDPYLFKAAEETPPPPKISGVSPAVPPAGKPEGAVSLGAAFAASGNKAAPATATDPWGSSDK